MSEPVVTHGPIMVLDMGVLLWVGRLDAIKPDPSAQFAALLNDLIQRPCDTLR